MGRPRPHPKNNPSGGGGGGGSESEIHAAARSGDLRAVESICNSNPLAVNSRDRHSRTPLHLASWSGHTEVVSYLCKNKADVGAAAMDDTGAIHFASQKGHLEVVRVLLASGVSVKAANRKGLTPLHYAAQGSNLNLVKYLVRKGANLGAKTKAGQTALNLANSDEVLQFLEECEQSSKKSTANKNVDDTTLKQSVEEDRMVCDHNHLADKAEEEDSAAREKRKGEEATTVESLSGPKKPRVSLGHLEADDDTQDGEEEE